MIDQVQTSGKLTLALAASLVGKFGFPCSTRELCPTSSPPILVYTDASDVPAVHLKEYWEPSLSARDRQTLLHFLGGPAVSCTEMAAQEVLHGATGIAGRAHGISHMG